MNEVTDSGNGLKREPLYLLVQQKLMRRLIEGDWSPGHLLPSEMELAAQLGVSQGTVRKALDAMTAASLLVRHQGKGTFVAQPEETELMFKFFRLLPDNGEQQHPTSTLIEMKIEQAAPNIARSLGLRSNARVRCIDRVRLLGGTPVIYEKIYIPHARFPNWPEKDVVPNNIYMLFSEKWGITITRADEELRAISANPKTAKALGCKQGTPILEICRVAVDLENRPVELRISHCLTNNFYYSAAVR